MSQSNVRRPLFAKRLVGGLLAALALLATAGQPCLAQLPSTHLGAVFPAGAKQGATLEVTISGANLDDVDRLQFSHAGITAEQKLAEPGPFEEGPQPVTNTFVVTVKADVPVGLYDVRAIGKYGFSNPRAFMVGALPESVETEPNDTLSEASEGALGSVVNGRLDKQADVDFYRIPAKRGQRILIDCWARRIDARTDATLILLDPAGREVTNRRDDKRQDPLVDVAAESDGDYVLKVFDSVYRGGDDYYYRLRMGTLPYIDTIFPPAAEAGGNRQFTVFGRNLPGGQPAGLDVDGRPLEKQTVNIAVPGGAAAEQLSMATLIPAEATGLDAFSYRLSGPAGLSNPALVGIATSKVAVEQEPNNTPEEAQALELPCELAGRFYPRGDRDWVRFEAKKGEEYTIEIISQRLGLPTDPNFLVQQVTTNDEGEEQVRTVLNVDDSGHGQGGAYFNTRTDDPAQQFTVPADGTYRILLRDTYSALSADPRNVYRLAIRKPQPDFRLVAAPATPGSALMLRKGGQEGIRVVAFRRDGFDGEIAVSVSGLPEGVTCPGAVIGPERHGALLVLSAADNAAAAATLVEVVGKATVGGNEVTRKARTGSALWGPEQQGNQMSPSPARLSANLGVSVSASEAEPFSLTAGDGKVLEAPRAGKLNVPVSISRREGVNQKVDIVAADLPANIDAGKLSLNGGTTSGNVELTLKNNTPTGTYTIHVQGTAQKIKYRRNPEASEAAAARAKELAQVVTDTAAKSKAAAEAKAAADKALADATAAVEKATAAKEAATKAVAEATAQLEAAKKTQANASADEKAAADKAVTDATAAKVKADEALVAAEKALGEAQTKQEAAQKAQAEAEKAATEAAELAKAAAEAKAQADQRANALKQAAEPKDVNVTVASTPVTLKITPGPVTLSVTSPKTPLKQGEKLEVPVAIQRLYGYGEAVTLNVSTPDGVGGLQIPNANIEKGQNNGKITITAANNATPGEHTLSVRATARLNNQNVVVSQPIQLQIQKVAPEPDAK